MRVFASFIVVALILSFIVLGVAVKFSDFGYVTENMVPLHFKETGVLGEELHVFYIDKYEAVVLGDHAESHPDKVPTTSLDYNKARQACENAGKRLCSYKEWVSACVGPNQNKYSFQNEADAPRALQSVCDVARTSNNTPGSLASASNEFPECKTEGVDVYNMIGSAAEWVDYVDNRGAPAGVAFYQSVEASHCHNILSTRDGQRLPESTVSSDIGFRCCADLFEDGKDSLYLDLFRNWKRIRF